MSVTATVIFGILFVHAGVSVRKCVASIERIGAGGTEVQHAVELRSRSVRVCGRCTRDVFVEDAELQAVRSLYPREVIGDRPVAVRTEEWVSGFKAEARGVWKRPFPHSITPTYRSVFVREAAERHVWNQVVFIHLFRLRAPIC